MIPNENGSRLEQICAWVPCVVSLREREREREREHNHKLEQIDRKERVCMHETL